MVFVFGSQFLHPDIFLIFILFGALLILFWTHHISRDPYGLFHLRLNKIWTEAPDAPPQTEWLNMGYWQGTNIFPEACRALAIKLIEAARYRGGDKVLDVGHGTGESLVLLLSDPNIPRPLSLTAITSLPAHHQRSKDRVARLLSNSQVGPKPDVTLFAGDAVYHPTNARHPLDPSSEYYDIILALDCAYHFNTRSAFLRLALDRLAPSGRIALADICFDRTKLSSPLTRFITSLVIPIPKENLISTDKYISEMTRIGYIDVQLEDITEYVFPGFIGFLKSRGWGWWLFGMVLKWYTTITGARFVIVSGSRGSIITTL